MLLSKTSLGQNQIKQREDFNGKVKKDEEKSKQDFTQQGRIGSKCQERESPRTLFGRVWDAQVHRAC